MSAASQAITTYIRTHMHRCEVQQDHPLLLRHMLSGTPSDDDLLPALHSRSGGAHCAAHPDQRATNFRRGTMVWYLSRATGAPCPFSRAGIRLCDYGEDGIYSSTKERKMEREREREKRAEQCGQKRKRPLRGCVVKGSESDSQNGDSPPPKVKLTLRLKPLRRKSSPSSDPSSTSNPLPRCTTGLSNDTDSDSDSQDDFMSVDSSDEDESRPAEHNIQDDSWSLPPYPRRSISIPCYTPSLEEPRPYFPTEVPVLSKELPYRRSPSVPYSVGSPPPDSEDEDDDFHISMTGARRHSTVPSQRDDFDWDADLDSEGDDTVWESPGPRSPSAPILHNNAQVAVKEEVTDVQGMLDAWEDFDSSVAGAKVAEVIAQATAHALENDSTSKIKTESLDSWSWESPSATLNDDWYGLPDGEVTMRIKQEDFDIDTLVYPETLTGDLRSPGIPGTSSSKSLFMGSFTDSPSADFRDQWQDGKKQGTVRPRAKTAPTPFSFFTEPIQSPPTSFTLPLTPPREPGGMSKPSAELISPSSPVSHSLAFLIQAMSVNSPTSMVAPSLTLPPPCISPLDTHRKGNTPLEAVVVVHTCQPCTPAISATQIEGMKICTYRIRTKVLIKYFP